MKNRMSFTYIIGVGLVILVLGIACIAVMGAVQAFFTANPGGLPGMLGIGG